MALVEDLYKKLSEGGYYTKSIEDLEVQLEDPMYRKKVHGVLTRDGLEDTDFETFDVKYTPLKKKEESVLPSMEGPTSGSLVTPEMEMPEPSVSSPLQRDVVTTTSQEPAMVQPDILKQFEEQTGKKISTTPIKKKEEVVAPQEPVDRSGVTYFPEGTSITSNPAYISTNSKGEIVGSDIISELLRTSSVLKEINTAPEYKYLMEDRGKVLQEVPVTPQREDLFALKDVNKKRRSVLSILKDVARYGKKAATNIFEDIIVPSVIDERERQRRIEEKAQKIFNEDFKVFDLNNPEDRKKYEARKAQNDYLDIASREIDTAVDEGADSVVNVLKSLDAYDFGFEYETGAMGNVTVRLPDGRKRVFDANGSEVEKNILKAFITSVVENKDYYKTLNQLSKKSMLYDQVEYEDLQKKLKEQEKELKNYVSLRPGEYAVAVFGKQLSQKSLENRKEYNRQKLMTDSILLDNDVAKYKEQESALKQAYQDGKIDYSTYNDMLNNDEYIAARENIINQAKDLQQFQDDVAEEDAYMQDIYTAAKIVQEERGNSSAYIGANLLKGFVDIFGSMIYLHEASRGKGKYVEDISVSDMASDFGGLVTEEYTQREDMPDWEYALGQIANYAPGLLFDLMSTGGGGTAAKLTLRQVATNPTFSKGLKYIGQKALLEDPSDVATALMSFKQYEDQFNADPATRDIPEHEKILLGFLMSYASAKLEKAGASKWLPKGLKGGIATSILSSAIKSVGKKASKEVIEAAIDRNISTMVAKGLINVTKAGVAEYATEGIQTAAEEGIKELYDTIKEGDYFEDKTLWQVASDMNEAGRIGLVGGAIMGSVTNSLNIAASARNNLQTRQIIKVLEDPDLKDIYKTYLTNQYKSGAMSKAEVAYLTAQLKITEDHFASIPDSIEDKTKAFELLTERNEISRSIAGKDEALIAGQKERIEQINNELNEISKNAVKKSTEQQQEGTADGGVVQREGTDQGQPQAGQGEGTVGQATQQETNLGDSTVEGGRIQETEVVDVEAQKADIEKAQKQLDRVESRLNPNANHPLLNVGQKYDVRFNLDVRDFKDERKDSSKDGVEVITKIHKPATVDENGEMISAAEVEVTRFDSVEQANEFINAQYNKYKTIAEEKLAKANTELAALEETVTQQPVAEETNIVPGETAVVSDVEITYPTNEEAEVRIEERTKPEYVEATSETLQEENVEQLSQELEGEFGLLTAENPMKQPLTEEENTQLNQKAEEWLKSRGYNPRRVTGKYDQAENSFFVPGLKFDDAVEFANQFNQESVAHSEGLVYQDGTVNPRVKQKDNFSFEGYSPESNFVSVVRTPDGLKTFSVGYDFDTRTERTAPSQSSMGTVISGTDVEIETRAAQIAKPRMTKIIANAAKAVSRILPDTKFIVHDTQDSFAAATGETNAGGYFDPKTNKIHINLEKANARTVAHEVFHAVLINAVKTDANAAATTKKMIEAISKKIDNDPELKKYLDKFLSQYEENIQNEEKAAELVGVLAEKFESSPESIKDVIKRWLDRIAKAFGLNPFNRNEVYDVLTTIARKTAKGKTIKQKDIKAIESSAEISNANKRFQSDFSDSMSKLTFVFDKNGNKFKKLEDDGYITRNKSIKDFNGEYMFLHQPDAAFSGMIYKDGEILVEGKGGVFYPIKFHEDGYFWASTDDTANKMAKDLNKVFEQNGGVIYMGLTTAPYDKLLSSTTMSNSVLDFFLSKAFDKNFSITPSQLKTMLNNAAKVTREKKTLIKKDGKPVLDKKGNKQYRIKLVGLGTQFKLNKSDSIDVLASRIKELLNPDITSFEDRKTFVEELIKEAANVIKSNPKSVEQFGKLFSQGIQNKYFKGITKTGKLSISAANMTQALSEMFTEPMLKEGVKRDKGGQVYAVLELRGKVKDIDSDKHESYPKAIQSEDVNNKVTLHILKDRFNWSEVFEDFETNDIVASKERENKIFPTSGVSVRGLRVNTSKIQDQGPAPRKQKANLKETEVRKMLKKSDKYIEDRVKKTKFRDVVRSFIRKMSDRQGDIKRSINGIDSIYSRRAFDLLINKAGATGYANEIFKEADKRIYKGLSSEDLDTLNDIIYCRRMIAINENRANLRKKAYSGLSKELSKELDNIIKIKSAENVDAIPDVEKLKEDQKTTRTKELNKVKKRVGEDVYKDLIKRSEMYKEPYTGLDGFSEESARKSLQDIKDALKEKKYWNLQERADEYFKVFNENLKRALDSGRITEEAYNALKDIEYSPIRTLKYIIGENELTTEELEKWAKIYGVPSSEIKQLGTNNNNEIISNTRWLLMMNINSSVRKSFENKLLNAVSDAFENATDFEKQALSEIIIENPVVGQREDGSLIYKYDGYIKKNLPRGYKEVTFFKDGVRKSIIMKELYADQLLDVFSKNEYLAFTGKLLGADLLRFFATGGNPLFIAGNIAADFNNILFFSDVYGKIKPVGAIHLAFDFVKNFLRSTTGIKFKEIKREYLEHGGAMDYMSADGIRNVRSRINRYKPLGLRQKAMVVVTKTLSFLGEKSEEAFRISVYEKTKNDLIKKWQKDNNTTSNPTGQDLEDIMNSAVREARQVIDFNQGGTWAKNIDSVLPYFNVAFQSVKRAREYYQKDPVMFGWSMLQAGVMGAGLMAGSLALLINGICDDDESTESCNEKIKRALDSISSYEKANYHIIFTGNTDENGEFEYIRIKKLPLLSMVTTFGDQLMAEYFLGMRGMDYNSNIFSTDSKKSPIMQTLKNSFPIDFTDLKGIISRNPAYSAYMAGWENYDTFKGEEIFKKPLRYKYDEINPEVEGLSDDNVNNLFKAIAPTFGLSPIRTQAFFEKIFTSETTNPLISLLYAVGNGMFVKDSEYKDSFNDAVNNLVKNTSRKLIRTTNKNIAKYTEEDKNADFVKDMNSETFKNEEALFKEVEDIYKNGERLNNEELNSIILKYFDGPKAKKYKSKVVARIKRRDLDKGLLDIAYEDDPELQAYYIYEKYGKTFDEEERIELNELLKSTGKRLSRETKYYYNKNYKLK